MGDLPTGMMILGWAMTLFVAFLAGLFWLAPERGMAFTQHRGALLPRVMIDRFFVFFMFMGAALLSRSPGWIAYAFLVTGSAALWNALIYRKAGLPYKKHLIPAGLSAIVAIWALMIYSNTGAA